MIFVTSAKKKKTPNSFNDFAVQPYLQIMLH